MTSATMQVPANSSATTVSDRAFCVTCATSAMETHRSPQFQFGLLVSRELPPWLIAGVTAGSRYRALLRPHDTVIQMSLKLTQGPTRTFATRLKVAGTKMPTLGGFLGAPAPQIDYAEDVVPYIPPLGSFRIQGKWGQMRPGVPVVVLEDFHGDA